MIEIKELASGYGNKTVIDNVSASFEKGKLISIIGPNGSGKSTLLKTLNAIIPTISGEVTVDGETLSALRRSDIAKKIAYLSQDRNIPDMTVEQMVLHGRFPYLKYPRRYTEKDRKIVDLIMVHMNVSEYAECSLKTLSGGMRQKVYIAMVLAQNTDYILLDEPTTYLDISHQFELMQTLKELTQEGKSIITVIHDLPLAFKFSDEIVVLSQGKIIAQDTPENILASKTIKSVFNVELLDVYGGFKKI